MEKAFISWSGGKDCTMALHQIVSEKKYAVESLFSTITKPYDRVTMHGVRKELITRQRFSLNIPSRKMYLPESTGHDTYNNMIQHEMNLMKSKGIGTGIFGDIFLEDLRKFREEKMKSAGLHCLFPLWKRDTKDVLQEFISLGYKAIVVCTSNEKLGKEFCGRQLNEQFLNDLPANVDPCGENGEFHTFVYEGPLFKLPVSFELGETVLKEYKTEDTSVKDKGFWFTDLIPK